MTLTHCLNKGLIENVVLKVSNEIERNGYPEENWDKFSENELFYELIACILGSRVRYETAKECAKRLKDEGLLNRDYLLRNPVLAESTIFKELKRSIYPPFTNGTTGVSYPYSRSKAKFIVQTSYEIYYNQATTLKALLKNCIDEFEARDLLVEICMGIGPKQASLFLRNIYYTENLAILDSHVIQYMKMQGLHQGITKSITRNQYIIYEKKLSAYADSLNKSLAKLDVAIWVVMRVVQREFKWE